MTTTQLVSAYALTVTLVACGAVVNTTDNPAIGDDDAVDAGVDGTTDADPPISETRTITLSLTGTGFGTVVSSPVGLSCSPTTSTCSGTFALGSTVTLVASPLGFLFWSGGCSGSATTCSFTITDDATVAAKFVLVQQWPDSLTQYCTDGTATIACPGGVAGQDSQYQLAVPVYVAAPNTITDTTTGLVWQRNPPYTSIPKAAAIIYCDSLVLDGQNDWRMPTRLELLSLVDAGRVGAPWPIVQFPGIPPNSFFWSSDVYAGNAAQSFAINTNYPVLYVRNNTGGPEDLVRCVRGAAFASSLTTAGGSVTDNTTGLVWQSATSGSTLTWQDALAYCETLALDGVSTWRLPSVKELASIVDLTQITPAISTAFSSRPASVFWTATPTPGFPTTGYAMDFSSGASASINHAFTLSYDVRCVH